MENDLLPLDAAALAQRVYLLLTTEFDDLMQTQKKLGCPAGFTPSSEAMLDGSASGQLAGRQFGKTPTRFGFVAKGSGKRGNEALVVLRGTAPTSDWLANTNVTLTRGPSGHQVHMGFYQAFDSYRPAMTELIGDAKTVHCVGHSLGGAMATMAADYLSENRGRNVKLYTFGAPRSGAFGQPRNLTRKSNVSALYRTYHTADPVTMLPIFPYHHVPTDRPGCALPWPGTSLSKAPHAMTAYMASIAKAGNSWKQLENLGSAASQQESVEQWLGFVGAGGAIRHLGTTALSMIRRALEWLLIKVVGGGIGLTATVGMTVLDRIAWVLAAGKAKAIETGIWTANLMTAILKWLGRSVQATVNVTVTFIRWVLGMFFSTVANIARTALDALP